MHRFVCLLVPVLALFVLGCGQPEAKPTVFENKHEGHGHSHEHNKMMLKDFGAIHVGLTAHLSKKDGNELDLVFETEDEKPVPQPFARLTAKATRKGEDETHTLEFEPAEKDERKDDPEGKCSRYTAKAPWIKHEDLLTVKLTLQANGQEKSVVWLDFNPKKFAHHDE